MPSVQVPEGHFTILYFASASSYTKKNSEHLKAPLQAGHLFDTLEKMYPGINPMVLVSCAVTVNLEYVDLDQGGAAVTIADGDEVAIIPPVSSG
jgi:molybdopterin converting factor small subunit